MVAKGLNLPSWASILDGASPPLPEEGRDAADFDHGWQCHVSSFAENSFRELTVFPQLDDSRRALLHSQSGGAASAWLRAIPSEIGLRMKPLRFLTAVRRRIRCPLLLSGGVCCRGCNSALDKYGDRAAVCAKSGRLKLRSIPFEKMWARILREARGKVRERVFLSEVGLTGIDPADGRNIEIVVTSLPLAHGILVAIDATKNYPLHADGTAWAGAAHHPGVSFKRAIQSKAAAYLELLDSNVMRLMVVVSEVGGRLKNAARSLLEIAALHRA